MKLATINYIDNGRQFLLLHRNKKTNDIHEGKYISVGGKFELGETPEECAIREIYEETGLVVNKLDLKGIITYPHFDKTGEDWYCFVYRVSDYIGELKTVCDEGTLVWVDYNQILSYPTWEGDYIHLKWILEERGMFSAKFIYQEEKLQEYDVVFYN